MGNVRRNVRRVATSLAIVAVATAASAGVSGAVDAGASRPAPVSVLSIGTPRGVKLQHATTVRVGARHKASSPYLHTSLAGAIAPKPNVYLVFWGKQWSSDPAKARPALTAFFSHLFGSTEKWGTILNQYCEGLPAHTINCGAHGTHVVHPTSSPLGGTWLDNRAAAPANATPQQIAAEAAKSASHFGNTTPAKNVNAIYVIASPHGAHPNGFPNTGFCAWHDVVKTSAGMLGYTNLPYVPDLGVGSCTTLPSSTALDGYFSTETHEYAESVTDLVLGRGWFDAQGNEIADLCVDYDARETLGGVKYDVQGLWSNQSMRCVT